VRLLAHTIGALEALLLVTAPVTLGTADIVLVMPMLGVTAAVGWLLAARVPTNPLGWLLLAAAGIFLLGAPAIVLGETLVETRPEVAAWLLWFAGDNDYAWFWLPSVGLLFTQVLLRFPDGRPPAPRWRWFARATVVVLVLSTSFLATITYEVSTGVPNPAGVSWVGENRHVLAPLLIVLLLICFLASAASLVWRYHRADVTTRTQIRWVAWAGALVVLMYAAAFAVPNEQAFDWVLLAVTLIPASIGVAVLRYRLYEIDRLISRTLAYAVVTATVLATYAVVVTSLTRLLPVSSTLAVAVATLAAATVFRPALRRVQSAVDRRFNRARYDARATVDAFGQRLRDAVDPEASAADLLDVVHRTLEPSGVGLWVRGRP
jgi:hypothetical protein